MAVFPVSVPITVLTVIAQSQPGSEVLYLIFRTNDVQCNSDSANDNTYIHTVIYHFQSNFMLAHLIFMSTFWGGGITFKTCLANEETVPYTLPDAPESQR